MSLLYITVLCFGFFQLSSADEIIGKHPSFDFFSAQPRNIFLKKIHPKLPNVASTRPSLRIVNGKTAARGQFCYQAYLRFSDGSKGWACGGSLVTPQLILTAAHCVIGATSAIVVLGGLDLSKKYEPGRRVLAVPSSGLRYHEDYDTHTIYNDIGVVKLTEAVKLNEYICTVSLPSCADEWTADPDNNHNYTVSGWGKTSDKTTTSKLMYVEVAGESFNSCNTFYQDVAYYDLTESQLCTSGAGDKGVCNGDSGGPLVLRDSAGNITQGGIVSLGISSCDLGAPSVYTDVRYFMDWLCPQF